MNKTSTFYFSAHKDKWISYVNIRLHLKILQVRTTVCKLKEDEQLILIKQICKIEKVTKEQAMKKLTQIVGSLQLLLKMPN